MKSEANYYNKTKADNEAFDQALRMMSDSITKKHFEDSFRQDPERFEKELSQSLKFFVSSDKTRQKDDEYRSEIFLSNYLNETVLPHGIAYQTVRLDSSWYRFSYGSMLGILKDSGQTVAIIQNSFGKYCYNDPASGKKIRITKSNADIFEAEAIVFYRPFPLRKIGITDLIHFMRRSLNIWDYISILLSFTIVTILGLFLPNLNSMLFSHVPKSKDVTLLISTVVFMISIGISTVIFNSVKQIVLLRMQTKIGIAINSATFMRILSLPASFFRIYSSGELYSYSSAISSMCNTLFNTVFSTSLTALMSMTYLFSIFVFAPALVIPAFITIAVSVFFMILSALTEKKETEKIMRSAAKSQGTSFAMISGIRKIRLTGSEKRAFARWAEDYSRKTNYTYNASFIISINPAIQTAISLVGMIVLYYMAIRQGLSVAHFQAFNVSYGMVSGAFTALASVVLTAAQIQALVKLAKPLMDTVPEVTQGGEDIDGIQEGIELSHVSFRYTEDQPFILNDLSLKIHAGEYIGIVGKTGCGKSTLIRLLLGFEKAQQGTIYYDGKDISTLNITTLRKHIGTVTQNGKLFPGSIFSNISISAPDLSREDAWKAAETAGIADDIKAMPMGMYTMISEGTGGISGGQKQRLMIARAIAPKPDLLIFDEATSALDNMTQEMVTKALNSFNSTRIVIAHRLSTIEKCDRILLLENGKITESGTYDELMELNGAFKALVERQQV